MTNFFVEYWDVLLFYSVVCLLLYLFRRKFEFQGVVALLKTKLGVNFMTKTGKKYSRFWDILSYVSIFLAVVGMIFITGYLIYGLYALFFVPDAPPTLSPVIPGVKVPGVPFTFPLWYTLIGLFFAVIVHEASHGIYSSAYDIKIKSSGFAFFGPLPGAFVEPDEKVMAKKPTRQQLAIMAAGPFSNMVLALVAMLLLAGVSALAATLVNEHGVAIETVQNDTGAFAAGVPNNVTITAIDDQEILNTAQLTEILGGKKPGETIELETNKGTYDVKLGESPESPGKAYLGVIGVKTASELKNPSMSWLFTLLVIIGSAIMWTYIISLGIGIANLLPIGPIDGGRMFYLMLLGVLPEKKAKNIFGKWSLFLFIIVLILVFVPIIKAVI
jgi:membrane-associated protease RseP (regulator of RpoE activity)